MHQIGVYFVITFYLFYAIFQIFMKFLGLSFNLGTLACKYVGYAPWPKGGSTLGVPKK